MSEPYDFPEEDYFTECKVVGFTRTGMLLDEDGESIPVNNPDGQTWKDHFEQGDQLEVFNDKSTASTYYRKKS